MTSGPWLAEGFDFGLNVVIKVCHFNADQSRGSVLQLMCAQHGHEPEGVQGSSRIKLCFYPIISRLIGGALSHLDPVVNQERMKR